MKVVEFFTKGQEVWVITKRGIKKASYLWLESEYDNLRKVYLSDLEDYRNEYGTVTSCAEFPETSVFTSREAAVEFLRTGNRESLDVASVHESMFNVGDQGWRIGENGVYYETFTHVQWRLGQFEYHTNSGGAAVYPERGGGWFHTREEAVEALISM